MSDTQKALLKGVEYLQKIDRPTDWDKILMNRLIQMGISVENAGTVIGIVAEERQVADLQGYSRGYNNGFRDAITKSTKSS